MRAGGIDLQFPLHEIGIRSEPGGALLHYPVHSTSGAVNRHLEVRRKDSYTIAARNLIREWAGFIVAVREGR